ncbi:hypothetical protein FA13DRAFT_1801345 [Coprinellus micaceus]|uniref:Uncharacterized protein n=1 Tax=Coprinellus micaceus TaxID=71717 RepID=A0A4Y7SEK7_COPMI|nr:hypothetical protein FA13DRAFT_1801345 [Coprinellus micaceus]
MKMTIALAMMPAQTAFAQFKDAASAALKQFVDGAADDDAFWGAVMEDLTNPLMEYLHQGAVADPAELPVKGGPHNNLVMFGDGWNEYLKAGKPVPFLSQYKAQQAEVAPGRSVPPPPARHGTSAGKGAPTAQGADKGKAPAESKEPDRQEPKEQRQEKDERAKGKQHKKEKQKDKVKEVPDKVKDKGKAREGAGTAAASAQSTKQHGEKRAGEGAAPEVAKKTRISKAYVVSSGSESESESEKEVSPPKPTPRMVRAPAQAMSAIKDVAEPGSVAPGPKPKAKGVKVKTTEGGATKPAGSAQASSASGQATAPAGDDVGTLGIKNLAVNALTEKYGWTCTKVNEVTAAVDTLTLGLAGFGAFLEMIESGMGENGPRFMSATERLAEKTAEILKSKQMMEEALEAMEAEPDDDDEAVKAAMTSHVKVVASVYAKLNEACKASKVNTDALQYTIAGLVAFMRLAAPAVNPGGDEEAMEVDRL